MSLQEQAKKLLAELRSSPLEATCHCCGAKRKLFTARQCECRWHPWCEDCKKCDLHCKCAEEGLEIAKELATRLCSKCHKPLFQGTITQECCGKKTCSYVCMVDHKKKHDV